LKVEGDMQQLFDVLFASSNKNKYQEAKKILGKFGINVGFYKCNLTEIQADSIKEIANQKAINAFLKCKKPVIVEDDGLFINALGGFPGPFSSYVFKTIGNNGILKLVKTNRNAKFQSVIGFCDKKKKPKLFDANVKGKIAKNIRGKGWGYDPIFTPSGKSKTYAELSDKNELSHRYQALKKFANWYLNKKKSIYR
jgi:XTP/dITP diphosphohydrolase